jgi:3-(3-hydroxy-phenyl)propionate hydroxylase
MRREQRTEHFEKRVGLLERGNRARAVDIGDGADPQTTRRYLAHRLSARAGEDVEAETAEARVRDRVARILDEIGHDGPWELEWWSTYSANTLFLEEYRCGRVFFAGDSAHIVPIFGVRGLNNGLADAHNIGWKLAYYLNGHAPESILDTYSPERRGATLDVFVHATKSAAFMTPPTRGWHLMRQAALSLMAEHSFVRKFADPRQMAPYIYADSPLTSPADDSTGSMSFRAGEVMPDARLEQGGFLSERLGDGFTVLHVAAPGETGASSAALELRELEPRLTWLSLGGHAADALSVADRSQHYQTAGTTVLVRPDMHIAAAWPVLDRDLVRNALRRALSGRPL